MNWLQRLPTPFQRRSIYLKSLVENIKNGGYSNHSEVGATLYYIIDALENEGINYQLTAYPKRGYIVKGIEDPFNI